MLDKVTEFYNSKVYIDFKDADQKDIEVKYCQIETEDCYDLFYVHEGNDSNPGLYEVQLYYYTYDLVDRLCEDIKNEKVIYIGEDVYEAMGAEDMIQELHDEILEIEEEAKVEGFGSSSFLDRADNWRDDQ